MKRSLLAIAILLAFSTSAIPALANNKIKFWDQQRKGANWFNLTPTREWLVAAKEAGIEVVRLAPDNWKSQKRDFLLGSADHFDGIVEQDFQKLKEVLDQANELGIKVVLTLLSLPGARYLQLNGDQIDLRLWRDPQYGPEAARFWKELAHRLKGHPAIVGYNVLNEPVPEKAAGLRDTGTPAPAAWIAKVANTPADLNLFNAKIVTAIREVDKETPIVIDCGWWAAAYAMPYLQPLRDDKVLYSFHMYEPYAYTNKKANKGRFSYPGKFLAEREVDGETKEVEIDLNRIELERILAPVSQWQKKYGIKSNRIFVGEFGCNRTISGAANYLADLIDIFNQHQWHWAFFTFRQDLWDGMDYELGTEPPGEAYWQAIDRGETPQLKRVDNVIWNVIKQQLKKTSSTGKSPAPNRP